MTKKKETQTATLRDYLLKHENNLFNVEQALEQMKYLTDVLFNTLVKYESNKELLATCYPLYSQVKHNNDILNGLLLKAIDNYDKLEQDLYSLTKEGK